MKKNIITYISTLFFIFCSYLLISVILAILYRFTTTPANIYNFVIIFCAYFIIILAGIYFSWRMEEKTLIHALGFIIIFILLSILLSLFKVNYLSLLIKSLIFFIASLACNLFKK